MQKPWRQWERVTDSAPPVGFLLHPDAPLHDPGWGHPEWTLTSPQPRDQLPRADVP